jgi:imidazolonepropionase-like amidohydrolase
MSHRLVLTARAVIVVGLALIISASQREAPPSHVFHNGKIVTVDPQFRIVEAMAILDGTVLAVGSNADMLRLAGTGTERVDLAGRTVLPGLIVVHPRTRNHD